MQELIIGGTGAQAQYCVDTFEKEYKCRQIDIETDFKVCDDIESKRVIVAHGNWVIKMNAVRRLGRGWFISLIQGNVSPYANIGPGCIINKGAILSSAVGLGGYCVVHSGAVLEHNVYLEKYVNVAANATLGGRVYVGMGTLIGLGAVVLPGIKIGSNCIIGAGAVITADVIDNAVMVGNPARILKFQSNRI